MTPKRSVVYRRDGQFLVETTNRSAEGTGLAGPARAVGVDAEDAELGAAVVEAARASEATLTKARDLKRPTPVMKLAKATSWKAFVKGASSVHAEVTGSSVELDAWQPADHDSFEPHDTVESVVVEDDPATVGKAVRAMFDAIG